MLAQQYYYTYKLVYMCQPTVIGRINMSAGEYLSIQVNAIIQGSAHFMYAHICGQYYRPCSKYRIGSWRRIPTYILDMEIIHLPTHEQFLFEVEQFESYPESTWQ